MKRDHKIFIPILIELELELIKAGDGVLESESATACIRFNNPFATNFNIDVSTNAPQNVTVSGIGECIQCPCTLSCIS